MNYKEKYEQAIKRAKAMIKVANNQEEIYNSVITIFPEFKESEDDRIRKAIGYAIGQSTHSDGTLINGVSSEEALAWLEKQGEHANFINKIQIGDKVTRNEDGVLVNMSQLKRVAKKDEKQSEQEVSVVDFKAKDWYVSKVDGKIYNAKFMEKTPTNQARKLEIEKAAMSATGIIEQEEWFIKGAEWSDKNPSYISLEKQGEQKPAFEMITPEESLGIDSETYNKIVDECIYGEQNPAEEYNITGISSKNAQGKLGEMIKKLKPVNEVLEQKPAWSEEDRQMKMNVLKYLSTRCNVFEYEEVECWLKSLKDRVQPKQDWSEEDERNLNDAILFIETGTYSLDKDNLINWLKSLRPQNTWKPSEEQMKALKHASNDCSIAFADMNILATLYEQLKALHRYEQDT